MLFILTDFLIGMGDIIYFIIGRITGILFFLLGLIIIIAFKFYLINNIGSLTTRKITSVKLFATI